MRHNGHIPCWAVEFQPSWLLLIERREMRIGATM